MAVATYEQCYADFKLLIRNCSEFLAFFYFITLVVTSCFAHYIGHCTFQLQQPLMLRSLSCKVMCTLDYNKTKIFVMV